MLPKNQFIEYLIKERCQAFPFEEGCAWFEFHKEFSSNEKYPEFEIKGEDEAGEYIQGAFNSFPDEGSEANLYLVLSHLEELKVEFYTFWSEWHSRIEGEEETFIETKWTIWTPWVDMEDWPRKITGTTYIY